MSEEDFKQIYKEEKILPIGEEESSNKIHELFYSHFVDQCFISIRDQNNSEIITVLPVDYHGNCAWKIDQNTQAMMKKMYSENTPIEINSKRLPSIEGTRLYIYAITMILHSEFTDNVDAAETLAAYCGKKLHRKRIKTYDFSDFCYSFGIALGDMSIRDYLENFYRENEVEGYPYILFYHSRRKKGGEPDGNCLAYAIYDAKEYLHTNKPNIQSIKEMTEMI